MRPNKPPWLSTCTSNQPYISIYMMCYVAMLCGLDYMFEDGFLADIKSLLFHLPNPYEPSSSTSTSSSSNNPNDPDDNTTSYHPRQTFFVSASLPAEARALALSMLRRFDTHVCALQSKPKPPGHISHSVLPVHTQLKPFLLLKLLQETEPYIEQAIVFVRTKQRCNQTSKFLGVHGV